MARAALESRAARRATPTTPRTLISSRADRGMNTRRLFPCKSGGVRCTPVSSRSSRSFETIPSITSSSRNRSRTHRPSSFGRLRNVFRSASKVSRNSRTKYTDLTSASGISRCSPSGVSRSTVSVRPKFAGFRYPRTGVRSSSSTTTFLWVEVGARLFTGKRSFWVECCYVPGSYVILARFFVNLLVLKGLASEPLPIDRKRTDSQVRLRHSPGHRYQPDLRILTRSTGSPPPGDLPGRLFLRPRLPDSQFDSANDRGRLARRLLYPGIYRLPSQQVSRRGLGVCPEVLLGLGRAPGGLRLTWRGLLPAGHLSLHARGSGPIALGTGRIPQSHHIPRGVFHRPGRASRSHSEQLSGFRASCRDLHFPESYVHSVLIWDRLPSDHAHDARGVSNTRGGPGHRVLARGHYPAGDPHSTAHSSRHALSDLPLGRRPRRAEGRPLDGASVLRYERLSDQPVCGHHFFGLRSHAVRQCYLSLCGRSRDATGPGYGRHRGLYRLASGHVAPGSRRKIRGDEAHFRLFASHRLLRGHSGCCGADSPSRSHHPGVIPARRLRFRVNHTHREGASLLLTRAASL